MSDTQRETFRLAAPLVCRRCEREGRETRIAVDVQAWVDAEGRVMVSEVSEKGAECLVCGGRRTIIERPAPPEPEPERPLARVSELSAEDGNAMLAALERFRATGASMQAAADRATEGVADSQERPKSTSDAAFVAKRQAVGCTACTWTGTARYIQEGRCPACHGLVEARGERAEGREKKHERFVRLATE